MTVGLYNLPSLQGWFWHVPIHLLLLDSQFFPNSASWGDRIHCYIILAIQFRPTVWWVFDVPLTWDPSDAQTKCQHCSLHPIISDNYARLIPSMFVRFPHQKLATNQWHFLTSTTLLFWDRTQLFWNHLFAEQLDCQRIRHVSQDFLVQVLMLYFNETYRHYYCYYWHYYYYYYYYFKIISLFKVDRIVKYW